MNLTRKKLHKNRTQGCTSGSQMADKMAATKAASGDLGLGNQIPHEVQAGQRVGTSKNIQRVRGQVFSYSLCKISLAGPTNMGVSFSMIYLGFKKNGMS